GARDGRSSPTSTTTGRASRRPTRLSCTGAFRRAPPPAERQASSAPAPRSRPGLGVGRQGQPWGMGETRRPSPSGSRDQPERYRHNFGRSPPLSLGVEEELLLVDEKRNLARASDAVLAAVPSRLAGRVSSEVFSEQIELKTGICHDAAQVLGELSE